VRLAETSGRSRRQVAEDRGIGLSTLRHWMDRHRDQRLDEPAARPQEDTAAELKRLRRENEVLRQERDILKRATAGSSGRRNVVGSGLFQEIPDGAHGSSRLIGRAEAGALDPVEGWTIAQ
jgi:transposase